jgi:hypothetical protein
MKNHVVPREQFETISDEFDAAPAVGTLPHCPICDGGVASRRLFRSSPNADIATISFTCGHVIEADGK